MTSIPRRRAAASAARSMSLAPSPKASGRYPSFSPEIPASASKWKGASIEERSAMSAPLMAASTIAVSSTYRQIGPTLSSDQQSAMPPARETRPNVGRSPIAPQRWLGDVMDPSVSVPIEKAQRPAAVAEADPALDPLEPSLKMHGLRVQPPYQRSL